MLAPAETKRWRCSKCDPSISPGHRGDLRSKDPELHKSDARKRRDRGCEKENPELYFWWAPGLRRCPKAVIPWEADEAVGWWADWKDSMGQLLPFGSSNMADEPAIVADVLLFCEREYSKIMRELEQRRANGK